MGLLDEVFPKKKETAKKQTTRVSKKDVDKLPTKKLTSSSNATSFFGSLKRGQGGVASPTPSSAARSYDVTKKSAEQPKPPDKEKVKKAWFRSPSKNILKKDPIKSSSASLHVVGGGTQKTIASADPKKLRPISVHNFSNVTLRRGQKLDGQNTADNLSRTSSITNLDAESQKGVNNKGGKPKKSASRDRLDKLGEPKKNDKKGVTKNNNKLESGDSPYPSIDSLQEEDLFQLRKQLQDMAQEKTNLAIQLGEQKGQLSFLQKEIQKLKSFRDESNSKVEYLTEENTMLRNRLRDVAHSPLSDNEKQQLLFDSHRHHSSAPASIATNLADDGNGGDTTCTTPDWDKHSSSNVSEVSVACLQDKINQMQETHYSTNEELQATLQELTDLQRQLTELQQENERLNEEKTLMMDSLCRQTERLNESRSEVESLKQMLYREKDDTGQFESIAEREQKLVELLKTTQDERETLMSKLEQINGELQDTRAALVDKDGRMRQLTERVQTLECTLDAKHAEHKLLDQELAQAKDQCSGKQIEINRLTDLLDNAKTKINELEQDRTLSDKSELDEMLDNARKEKDALESEVAHLKEQLAISRNETEKFKEQVSILQEEVKVTRNNAKTTQSDLEYKCEKIIKEKNILNEQLQEFQEAINELQVQSQCQLDDKRQLSAVLSETQRNFSEAERKNLNLEHELEELKKLRAEENEEWEKFQNDLLTSVRVANDFKTEAQLELHRMIVENKNYRDRERQLKAEIDKLKGKKNKPDDTATSSSKSSSKEDRVMDIFIKRPNKGKRHTKPIEETKRTLQGKTANSVEPQHKPVKRRDRKVACNKAYKTLSIEEEVLLNSLNSWYENIDQNIPDENLTEEQKVIRKLKVIYEDENLRTKPVAHKPKDQLAISKPLLDSVLNNPKLKEIITNPHVRTIEDMQDFERETPEIRGLIQNINRMSKAKSVDYRNADKTKRVSTMGRSQSYDEKKFPIDNDVILYRSPEAEDLTKEQPVKVQRKSSILPSDSVSNISYRSSTSNSENVTLSTLDLIVSSIPKNIPENDITKKQQFALKLKTALDNVGKRHSLKKLANARNLKISAPIEQSVMKNPQLKQITENPIYIDVERRNSDTEQPQNSTTLRQSKSYGDLMHISESSLAWRFTSSSSETLSGGEFNVETGTIGEFNSDNYENSSFVRYSSFFEAESHPVSVPYDSLTYNETTQLRRKKISTDKGLLGADHPLKNVGPNKRDEKTVDDERTSIVHLSSKYVEDDKNSVIETSVTMQPSETTLNKTSTNHKDIYEKLEELQLLVNEDQESEQIIYPNQSQTARNSKNIDKVEIQSNETVNDFFEDNTDTANAREYITDQKKQGEVLDSKFIKGDAAKNRERIATLKNEVKDIFESNQSYRLQGSYYDYMNTSSLERMSKSRMDFLQDQIFVQKPKVKTLENYRSAIVIDDTKDTVEATEDVNCKDLEESEPDRTTFLEVTTRILELIQNDIDEPTADEEVVYKDIEKSDADCHVSQTFSGVTSETPECTVEIIQEEEQIVIIDEYPKENNITLNEPANGHYDCTDGQPNKISTPETNLHKDLPDTDKGYDYHDILKENRYGITSPLNLRMSYKNVVEELKRKYSNDEEITSLRENNDVENDNIDNFFDDFFKVRKYDNVLSHCKIDENVNKLSVKRYSADRQQDQEIEEILDHYNQQSAPDDTVDVVVAASQLEDQIDKEMEAIIEKYLHQPVSKIIMETADCSAHNKFETTETPNTVKRETISSEPPPEFTVDNKNSVVVNYDEIMDLIDKVDSFIDNERQSVFYEDEDKEKMESCANKSDEETENLVFEEISSKMPPSPSPRFKGLTKEEVKLIRLTRRQRFSRPLSEVNREDIDKVREIASNYVALHQKERNQKIKETDIPTELSSGQYSILNTSVRERRNSRDSDKVPLRRKSLRSSDDKRSSITQRKVKSVAEHFERLSLTTFADSKRRNFRFVTNKEVRQPVKVTEKKPKPKPRIRNQVTRRPAKVSDSDNNDDSCLKLKKMTETEENFSEHHIDHGENSKVEAMEVPGLHESIKLTLGDKSKSEVPAAEENAPFEKVTIKKSEKFLENGLFKVDSSINLEDPDSVLCGASVSAIAVAGKFERLDLTQPSKSNIEEFDAEDESHLNLFHLDEPGIEDAHSDLGEASGPKPWDGYKNTVFPSDVDNSSENGSDEEIQKNLNIVACPESNSKPKIIDFVPLDEGTRPVFHKDDGCPPSYDTLERETAFHILSVAAATAKEEKMERRSISKIVSEPSENLERNISSRSSFSAAKKMFEALAEANSERRDTKSPVKDAAKINKPADSKSSNPSD